MSRPLAIGPVAVLLYAIAWLLPVADGGSTLSSGVVPGWEALRVALSPLWRYDRFVAEGSLRASLAVASGVTNLLFVAAVWAMLQARAAGRAVRWIAFPLLIAALVNATWVWSSPAELSWGYYCWLASFLLLALAADRQRPAGIATRIEDAVEHEPV